MRELTCIGCPIGCALTVQIVGEEICVCGNGCPRGERYAREEVTCPVRIVASTVELVNGTIARVSVKTERAVPKGKIMECMDEIRRARMLAPVRIGDVAIENCAGTGINVVVTKNVDAKSAS